MRKTLLLLLSLALLLSVSMAANAAVYQGSSASIPVNGLFQAADPADVKISADIVWDEMTFTYTEGAAGQWLPDSHSYAADAEGSWSGETRTITVTNHSNTDVTAQLSFEGSVSGLTGTFTESSGSSNDGVLAIATAEGTAAENAPAASAQFGVSGSGIEENTPLGTITVSISSASGSTVQGTEPVTLSFELDSSVVSHTVIFYDADKNELEADVTKEDYSSTVEVPSDAEYFRVSYLMSNVSISKKTAQTAVPDVSTAYVISDNGTISVKTA